MRLLFRELLRKERCEYLLSFWLDIEDFRIEIEKPVQVNANPFEPDTPQVANSSNIPMESLGLAPAESNQYESLNDRPFLIYNTYFSPAANCGLPLDIGEDLLKELQISLEDVLKGLTKRAMVLDIAAEASSALDIGVLQVLLELYGRIQSRVFRIMVLEYMPKFIKSENFLRARKNGMSDDSSSELVTTYTGQLTRH